LNPAARFSIQRNLVSEEDELINELNSRIGPSDHEIEAVYGDSTATSSCKLEQSQAEARLPKLEEV
jgi:hypothetical protein